MTAETLKPFITPQNVESFPTVHSSVKPNQQFQRKINILAIGISIITLVFLALFSGYTIWLSLRISSTETEVVRLNKVIVSLQNQLGINYIEEQQDFEKEYQQRLIDDPSTLDEIVDDYDIEDDDYDDSEGDKDDKGTSTQKLSREDEEDYDAQIEEYLKKFNNNYDDDDEDEDSDAVTGDSLYNDFEKYKDSKTKDENVRVTRSIADAPHEAKRGTSFDDTHSTEHDEVEVIDLATSTKRSQDLLRMKAKMEENVSRRPGAFVREDNMETKHRSPLRQRSQRRHRFPIKKSGESLLSAKYTAINANAMSRNDVSMNAIKPAAHFHLYQKMPHHHAYTREEGYNGDVYLAHHPSWSNEVNSEQYFAVQKESLTVREPGLYYVYAQICYDNTYDQNGFVIFHNHKPFLQCLNTVPTNRQKIHTCHTSGLVYLRENETIHIRDFHNDHSSVLKNFNDRSYFGLMKV